MVRKQPLLALWAPLAALHAPIPSARGGTVAHNIVVRTANPACDTSCIGPAAHSERRPVRRSSFAPGFALGSCCLDPIIQLWQCRACRHALSMPK